MGISGIEIRPVAGAIGAEIHGVDLSQALSNSEFDAVHQAFLDHQVIFFRGQTISPEQHIAFGRRFGELDVHPYADGTDEHPEIIHVLKEARDHSERTFGGAWHTDVTFYEKPALGSILYALEVPESGGDTQFANMYLAYESLSDGLKEILAGMTAIHSASRAYGERGRALRRDKESYSSMKIRTDQGTETEVEHPVIRTHPETGRKGLFVNRSFTLRFKGWSEEESKPLLEYLYTHAVRPEFTCRFRWEKGSIAFWDNRCTHHFAINDYHGQRRSMHRVTVCGDRPV
jgi:taurine dioxygenase